MIGLDEPDGITSPPETCGGSIRLVLVREGPRSNDPFAISEIAVSGSDLAIVPGQPSPSCPLHCERIWAAT